jgi:hypothetical protein
MLFVFFSLTDFSILSLFSLLVFQMIICHRKVLFWSSLFDVLEASCSFMGNSFLRFGKFSIILLLNILCIPLVCTSSHSSMLLSLRIDLLMEWLSSCIFLSQVLSCLTEIYSVISLISILSSSPEILSSTCSSLLEWPPGVIFI